LRFFDRFTVHRCARLFTVCASRPVDKTTGLRCDQTITLCGTQSAKNYPDRLRRIRYTDPTTGKRLVLLAAMSRYEPPLMLKTVTTAPLATWTASAWG